jgi:hypothetical protein
LTETGLNPDLASWIESRQATLVLEVRPMSLRDTARAVVDAHIRLLALFRRPDGKIIPHALIDALQHELAMTADRDALLSEIIARRQTDSVQNMRQFRIHYRFLLSQYANALGHGERRQVRHAEERLEEHLFGSVGK